MCYVAMASGFLLASLAAGSAPASEQASRPCCFQNDRYVGVCQVTLVRSESCDSILRYLNSPNTVGKTYCGTTRLRGGWRAVPCPPDPTPAAPRASTGGAAGAAATRPPASSPNAVNRDPGRSSAQGTQ